MTDFYFTIEREPGEPKEVHGPYPTYVEAHKQGLTHARRGEGKVEVHRSDLVCDFCSAPAAECWAYPANDFSINAVGWASSGEWAACEICHALIEADDWEGLFKHSLVNFMKLYSGVPIATAAASIRLMHDSFFKSRTGDPVRKPE